MIRRLAFAIFAAMFSMTAIAGPCPGHPDALGTERVLAVDPGTMPRIGRKEFAATLPLGPKELVLTFDDGPWPTTTPKVLEALKQECLSTRDYRHDIRLKHAPFPLSPIQLADVRIGSPAFNSPISFRYTVSAFTLSSART